MSIRLSDLMALYFLCYCTHGKPYVSLTVPDHILSIHDNLPFICRPIGNATSASISVISLCKNTTSRWKNIVKTYIDSSTAAITQKTVWFDKDVENRASNIKSILSPSREALLQFEIKNGSVQVVDSGFYRCFIDGNTGIGASLQSFSPIKLVKIADDRNSTNATCDTVLERGRISIVTTMIWLFLVLTH